MNRNGLIETTLSVNDNTIESTNIIKVLGVTFDARLSFTPHITLLCSRASRQINALRRISKFLSIESRLSIYKAFIFSNFTYSPVTWLFCGKRTAKNLKNYRSVQSDLFMTTIQIHIKIC